MAACCPLCRSEDLERVLRIAAVPVLCNELWPSEDAAKAAPQGEMDLTICRACGLMFNAGFDEALITYASGYENALHFSPHFRAFAEDLCAELVARHDLEGKDIVELGCGDGFILAAMVRHGVKTAIGFDPSMEGKHPSFLDVEGVEIVPELFRAGHIDRDFDVLLCRHVLEHLPDPVSVLSDIRAAIGEAGTPVYFEQPNGAWILESRSVWDVIYEHFTYWSPVSVETLFRRTGFAPAKIGAGYGDQFLIAEGTPAVTDPGWLPPREAVKAEIARARAFAAVIEAERTAWQARLAEMGAAGRHAVIWGAGSKGITFSTMLPTPEGTLSAMIDLNARKHGKFIPGTGLRVAAPDEVAALAPDLVLIANALYADEIAETVRSLGLSPDFATIVG
ncbi:MAG: methyltransferase domain-containing protein [Pseudomonadota bacterium]